MAKTAFNRNFDIWFIIQRLLGEAHSWLDEFGQKDEPLSEFLHAELNEVGFFI